MAERFTTDVAIFGGGIAGLWLFRKLKGAGYRPILIEKNALGAGQTLAAQGIIHAGLKYSLEGVLSGHSQSLSAMPNIWKDCLASRGEVDLTTAKILANCQYLWSPSAIAENIVSFFASKMMRSKVRPVPEDQRPLALKNPEFKGKVYQLSEIVVDTKSVVQALAGAGMESIYKADTIEIRSGPDGIEAVILSTKGVDSIRLRANHYIFTAGIGNEFFAEQIGFKPEVTQRRPLQMLMVADAPADLYGHCLAKGSKPRVTISTHFLKDRRIWYLGGAIAEKAVDMTPNEAISWGKREMQAVFPWIEWDARDWKTFLIDRAEPHQLNRVLPTEPAFLSRGNALMAWPTKMVFAPGLAAKILTFLRQNNFNAAANCPVLPLEKPAIGTYPWEEAF